MYSFIYNGLSYHGFTREMAKEAGVPEHIIDKAVLDVAWDIIRNRRNFLIKETDWTQVVDTPISEDLKAQYAAYRQALRDLPQSTDNPDEIVWPVKPE